MLKKILILWPIVFNLLLTAPQTDAETTEENENTEETNEKGKLKKTLETSKIIDVDLMKVVLIGFGAGILGGVVSVGIQRLNSSDDEELAHPFWIERLGVGANTGVIVIWFIQPKATLALVTFSLISGSVGPSIFVALQNRVKATLQLRRAQDVAEQERIKAEQEKVKANASLAQETLNQIRNQFRQMRDQNEPPTSQQWDQLWETLRELETITPQWTKQIANPLKELKSKLNGKALQQEQQLIDEVDAVINQARAFIKMNQTNAHSSNTQSDSSPS